LGELIFYAVLGPGLPVPLVLTVLRTREGLQASGAVFLLLLLGGFGVDLIHSALLDLESMDSWTMSGGPWTRFSASWRMVASW
jgi:hypothetical protein